MTNSTISRWAKALVSTMALLAAVGLTGCTGPTPEEVVKRDATYIKEFEARGFTNPIKINDWTLSDRSVWAVSLGSCRLEFTIDGSQGWKKVADATTWLKEENFSDCKN